MKQYKLRKWYPSLPKDWEVGMLMGQRDRAYFTPCGAKYMRKDLPLKELVNEDFWEEVLEEKYEILSFKNINYGRIITKKETGYWSHLTTTDEKLTLEHCLGMEYLVINSVKRLSDGEVFSLGDFIKESFYEEPINEIREDDLWAGGVEIKCGNRSVSLNTAVKLNPAEGKKLFSINDIKDAINRAKSNIGTSHMVARLLSELEKEANEKV